MLAFYWRLQFGSSELCTGQLSVCTLLCLPLPSLCSTGDYEIVWFCANQPSKAPAVRAVTVLFILMGTGQ